MKAVLIRNPDMAEKWVEFWKGIYVLAFGVRTFLVGNFLFDMWPASLYQLSTMKFSKDSPRRGRAIISLLFSYLCALITILELFIMFNVSKRISIMREKQKIEEEKEEQKRVDKGVREAQAKMKPVEEKQEIKIDKMLKEEKKERKFDYHGAFDEGKEQVSVPKKDYSSMHLRSQRRSDSSKKGSRKKQIIKTEAEPESKQALF